MPEEILINVTPREVRAAVIENGMLQEVLIERTSRQGLIGNCYKGRVSRVLPGMQAAFIEIGLDRTAFLHVSDIAARRNGDPVDNQDESPPAIRELVAEGQEILVQVLKDPLGSKGARLTTFITLPSRYLVLMPHSPTIGVSARIEDDAERDRLKGLMEQITADGEPQGFIVRTAAEGVSHDALRADMLFLQKLWAIIRHKADRSRPGDLVHEDLALSVRVIRDLVGADIERVRVDSADAHAQLKQFADTFVPELGPLIEQYSGSRPILDLYGAEDEIQKALGRKVGLKSGGYVIFDQTEAMTTVDVNTGAYVGYRNLEETIFRTNLEAAVAIARQLRLRNLGGIIIVDFIDMEEQAHQAQVLEAFEAALAEDHARTQISEVSVLGLVEMTRKRTRESLEHVMCRPCPTCDGAGYVKSPETVCYEIFRDVLRQHRQFKFKELLVLAHEEVIELMLDEESENLAELEALIEKPIRLQVETRYAHHQYDVVLM